MNNAMNMLNAGQPSDMHLMLGRVAELIDVMRANRERTQSLVDSAEEIAIRAHSSSTAAASSRNPASAEVAAAAAESAAQASHVAELTRANHSLQSQVRAYAREQKENTRLIGEYETAMNQVTQLVRDFGSKKDLQLAAQAREYNAALQEEKDQHLATRLARDEWQASYARAAGMLRTAYALRCAEEERPVGVVQALQAEVRALRKVVGLEEQRDEHEAGWPVLKDALGGEGEENDSGEP